MSQLQRLGRTFATDATFGDLRSELLRQGSNYAKRKLVSMADQGGRKIVKKGKDLMNRIKNTYLKKKKTPVRIMPKKYVGSVTNSQAGRASMKKTGKIKNIRKGKKVRVPAKLRKQVKQVLAGGQYTGTYNTVSQGTIGIIAVNDVSTSTTIYVAASGTYNSIVAADVSVIPQYTNTAGPAWVYWGASMTGPASATIFQNQFEHFSPMQFLDAASKLWNNKYGVAESYYVNSDNNIILDVIKSTGVPSATNASVTGAQNAPLRLNIQNSYAKYTLKNNSLRSYKIEIFHCTPKLKFPTKRALTDLFQTCQAELSGVDASGVVATAQRGAVFMVGASTNSTVAAAASLMQHIDFDPKDSPQWRSRWNYQKVTIVIAAGETCEHSIQGPKNTILDFSKVTNTAGSGTQEQIIPSFCKGFSTSVFFRVLPDMVTATDATQYNISSQLTNAEAAAFGSTGQVQLPIAVQVQQGYSIKVPEQAGFIQRAVAAGTPQWMNMNRRMKRYDSMCVDPTKDITYAAAQEEQPSNPTTKAFNS